MTEQKIIDIIMDSIVVDGVCPELVLDEGFVVESVGMLDLDTNTSNYVEGVVTLDLEDNDLEISSIQGKFKINDNKVEFDEFVPV